MKTTIGIDNGPTGSIGIICPHGEIFEPMPAMDSLHYGKKGTISKRLDWKELRDLIVNTVGDDKPCLAFVERPFTGQFVKTAISAARFFEATLIVLEDLGIGYRTIDSKVWQKPILGDVKGSANLKKASRLRGIEMYPEHATAIKQQKDADGLLIAHHFHFS